MTNLILYFAMSMVTNGYETMTWYSLDAGTPIGTYYVCTNHIALEFTVDPKHRYQVQCKGNNGFGGWSSWNTISNYITETNNPTARFGSGFPGDVGLFRVRVSLNTEPKTPHLLR